MTFRNNLLLSNPTLTVVLSQERKGHCDSVVRQEFQDYQLGSPSFEWGERRKRVKFCNSIIECLYSEIVCTVPLQGIEDAVRSVGRSVVCDGKRSCMTTGR